MEESQVQRLLQNALEDEREGGKPISARARQNARSVEAYLKAGVRPRWMERLMEIDRGVRGERQRLGQAAAGIGEGHAKGADGAVGPLRLAQEAVPLARCHVLA